MRRRRLIALAVLAACGDLPPYTSGTSIVIEKDLPVPVPSKLDVLLVIDDSLLMTGYRDRVALSMAGFMGALATTRGGFPDLRLAVVTADLADGSAFHVAAQVPNGILQDRPRFDGTRATSYSGTLADALSSLVDVGSSGSDLVQPLAAAERALALHPAFLRRDAQLAIIVIAPHDDASSGSIAEHARRLESLKDSPGDVIFEAITGEAAASCTFDGVLAFSAPRLAEMVGAFPNRSTLTTICQRDFADGITFEFGIDDPHVVDPCLERELFDSDPDRDGIQPICSVSDVQRVIIDESHSRRLGEQLIPACDEVTDSLPCWKLRQDPVNCVGTPDEIVVTRRDFPPPNDHIIIECLAE